MMMALILLSRKEPHHCADSRLFLPFGRPSGAPFPLSPTAQAASSPRLPGAPILPPAAGPRSVHLRDAADPRVGVLLLCQHAGEADAAGGDDGFDHAVALCPDLDFVLMHVLLLLVDDVFCRMQVSKMGVVQFHGMATTPRRRITGVCPEIEPHPKMIGKGKEETGEPERILRLPGRRELGQ